MQPKAQPISLTVASKNKKGLKTLLYVTLLLANSIDISAYGIGSRILVDILVACLLIFALWFILMFMSTKLGWFHLVDCLDLVDILAVTDQVH